MAQFEEIEIFQPSLLYFFDNTSAIIPRWIGKFKMTLSDYNLLVLKSRFFFLSFTDNLYPVHMNVENIANLQLVFYGH